MPHLQAAARSQGCSARLIPYKTLGIRGLVPYCIAALAWLCTLVLCRAVVAPPGAAPASTVSVEQCSLCWAKGQVDCVTLAMCWPPMPGAQPPAALSALLAVGQILVQQQVVPAAAAATAVIARCGKQCHSSSHSIVSAQSAQGSSRLL
jgi:hypothetical protein